MSESKLEPKIWTVLREGYTRQLFYKDLVAGVLVGIVALPLSIALAIASGVKPEQGLYTAIVAGFLISAFSGSRVQIGGPTGAFIVLVYNIVHQHGYEGLAVATVLAGLLLVALGLTRVGAVIKFIPYPVTVGFTSGIAIIIFVSQWRDLLGLRMPPPPAAFVEKIMAYGEHAGTANPYAVGLAVFALVIIWVWPRVVRAIPGSLVAILAGTLLVQGLDLPIETIGSRFGHVPDALPRPGFPEVPWRLVPKLFSPALAIALLAGIESLLSAVVADGMTGRRHRSNMELVAQGIANIASPFFGGIPATGAIARTATNVKNGGATPVAGMIHALTVMGIMVGFGRWAALIPMPVLAAILVKVAFDMGEFHLLAKLLKSPRGDVLVLVSTFALTILADLAAAIEAGVVLASFLFMHRMAQATELGFVTDELQDNAEDEAERPIIPDGVEVFEIYGPFFFGAADRFKTEMRNLEKPPKVLILRMRHVPTMDSTGLRALEDVYEKARKEGTVLKLSGVQAGPRAVMRKAGFLDRMGSDNVHDQVSDALEASQHLVARSAL
jgi:SulP family sulfate permease